MAEVEISHYGAGLQLIPAGRTSQVVIEEDVPVVTGDTRIADGSRTGRALPVAFNSDVDGECCNPTHPMVAGSA